MQNKRLLQDCSDKLKWILSDVPLFTCACEADVQISHSVTDDPGSADFKLAKKNKKTVTYDPVKIIHHSPPGAHICLFVFLGERFAEFGFWDVCDSCVLCALSFFFFFSLWRLHGYLEGALIGRYALKRTSWQSTNLFVICSLKLKWGRCKLCDTLKHFTQKCRFCFKPRKKTTVLLVSFLGFYR